MTSRSAINPVADWAEIEQLKAENARLRAAVDGLAGACRHIAQLRSRAALKTARLICKSILAEHAAALGHAEAGTTGDADR
jgi:hypothetical protein